MIVARWHTHEKLFRTHDLTGGHASRVTVMALRLRPQLSREGIILALTHDIGEKQVGDFSYNFKKANPEIADVLFLHEKAEAESLGFFWDGISLEEAKLIKICDWLDSYLWAHLHEPNLVSRTDWKAQLAAVLQDADDLGFADEVVAIVNEALQ